MKNFLWFAYLFLALNIAGNKVDGLTIHEKDLDKWRQYSSPIKFVEQRRQSSGVCDVTIKFQGQDDCIVVISYDADHVSIQTDRLRKCDDSDKKVKVYWNPRFNVSCGNVSLPSDDCAPRDGSLNISITTTCEEITFDELEDKSTTASTTSITTTPSSNKPPSPEDSKKNEDEEVRGLWLIIGISVGVAVLVIILVVLAIVFWFCFMKKSRKEEEDSGESASERSDGGSSSSSKVETAMEIESSYTGNQPVWTSSEDVYAKGENPYANLVPFSKAESPGKSSARSESSKRQKG